MNRRQLLQSAAGAIGALSATRVAHEEPVHAVEGVAWLATGSSLASGTFVDVSFGPLPEVTVIPMPAMEPGRVYCSLCDAGLMPSLPWQGLTHVAVRLWDGSDTGRTLSALQMPTRVWIDGERVRWAVEAIAGDPGWALLDLLTIDEAGRERGTCCPICRRGDLREFRIGHVVFDQERAKPRELVEAIEAYLLSSP